MSWRIWVDDQRAEIERNGQTQLHSAEIPLDLFFWNLEFHASCCQRRRQHALLDHPIDVSSPEDLIVCQVVYDRPKDRAEVREVLLCTGERMNVGYTIGWLERILGGEDERVTSFRRAASELTAARSA